MTRWNLLIVDDEDLNLEIIQEFLDDGPYDMQTAGNGAIAWDLLNTAKPPFDLVILDRMMPVMDGMELLRRMKAEPRFADVPVIMQTAASSSEQIREGMAAGCYYYLTKPYKSTALIGIVHAVLEEERAKRLLREETLVPPDLPAISNAEYAFTTLEQAHKLSLLLAAECPEPPLAAMGLSELLVNAVEHGNLGISYAEKTRLKQGNMWESEVERRLQLPEYRNRKATVSYSSNEQEVVFTITDEGAGFDASHYLDFDPARAFDPNGRGIAMASKLAFSHIEYRGCGNQVVATIRRKNP